MAENSSSSSSVGIGLTTILTVIFVLAKIFGKITWSWWWVFAPVWISWGMILAIFLVLGAITLLVAVLD